MLLLMSNPCLNRSSRARVAQRQPSDGNGSQRNSNCRGQDTEKRPQLHTTRMPAQLPYVVYDGDWTYDVLINSDDSYNDYDDDDDDYYYYC